MSSKSNLSNRFHFAQEMARNRESTESVAKFMTSEESDSAQMRTDPIKMPSSKYTSARGIVERQEPSPKLTKKYLETLEDDAGYESRKSDRRPAVFNYDS